ncbi:MAG: hypothetical protein ACT6FC_02335, partial [Methanosarcinaceae archaeon]
MDKENAVHRTVWYTCSINNWITIISVTEKSARTIAIYKKIFCANTCMIKGIARVLLAKPFKSLPGQQPIRARALR